MSRLPTPGQDDNVWGQILNDFLNVAHNSDGTLQSSSLRQAGAVTSINGQSPANGSITLTAATIGAPTSLSGDSDVTIATPTNNQILSYDGPSGKWINKVPGSGVGLDGTSSDIQPLGTTSAGTTGLAADAGHIHAMPRLDQTLAPTSNVSFNSQKIINLANGFNATDAAAFGQIPLAGTTAGTYAAGNDGRFSNAVQLGSDLGGTVTSPQVISTHLSSALPINQGGTGSSTQNFVDLTTNQTKSGTLTAPLQDLGGQVFNVKAYGATGNGSTDDTSAICNAITAANTVGAGQVYFPGGTYVVSSSLTSPLTGITINGSSLGSVIQISASFSGSSVIPLNSINTAVTNLQVVGGPSTTTASNAVTNFIEITGASACLVDNIFSTYLNGYIIEAVGSASSGPTKLVISNIRGQYNAYGIHTLGLGASNHNMQATITNVNLQETTLGDIILVEDSNDVQITNFNGSIYGNSTSNASALRVHGACASILIFNIDVGAYPTKPANTPTVLIESGANGNPSNINLFGGIIQDGQIGLSITGSSKQIIAQGLRIQGNGQYGLSISDTATDIQINNSIFNTNGQTAGVGNYDVFINSTSSGINIMRCDFSTPLGSGTGQVSYVGYNVSGNTAIWGYCSFLGSGGFNITNIFSGSPLSSLFNRIGVNVASINIPNTAFSNSIALPVYSGGSSNAGIVIQGAPGQVSKLLQIEDYTGTTYASFDVAGNLTAVAATLTGVSTITTASTGAGMSVTDSVNGGEYRAKLDSTHYLSTKKKSTSGSQIQAVEASGNSTLDLDAIPSDGVSQSIVRVGRNTTTTNLTSGFYIYKADGSATVQSFFGTQTNSYLNATGGSVAIGKSSAGSMLDVNGKITMTGFNLSSSPTNGYVLTSDGGGNGTWQAIPGFSISAADSSIVIGGTASAPTIETSTLDIIATDHPPATGWSNNSMKITNLANGTVSTDAATFGQTPAGGAIVSGQYLCTPSSYAPASQTALAISSQSFSAFSSTNVNTGSFVAPASGNVMVETSFVIEVSAVSGSHALGLCAHGSTTPMVSNIVNIKTAGGATEPMSYTLKFLVTGLTSGTSYNFDLMGCVVSGDTLTILAIGATATSPTLSNAGAGAPVVMSVQAI